MGLYILLLYAKWHLKLTPVKLQTRVLEYIEALIETDCLSEKASAFGSSKPLHLLRLIGMSARAIPTK